MFYNEDEDVISFFTKGELKEFLASAREHITWKDYTLFRLLAVTGLRKGEALALHRSDIDFNTRSLIVRKH